MKKVVFVGGPGSGKSTISAEVFVELKKRGANVELVTEWIRQDLWTMPLGKPKVATPLVYQLDSLIWSLIWPYCCSPLPPSLPSSFYNLLVSIQ